MKHIQRLYQCWYNPTGIKWCYKKIPCLLIIDNADTALAQWYAYLPNQPDWHILVTSREKIRCFDLKELDFLSLKEGIALFLKHYTHKKIDKEDIKKLVTLVDFHTLTIEILAKTAYSPGRLEKCHKKRYKDSYLYWPPPG